MQLPSSNSVHVTCNLLLFILLFMGINEDFEKSLIGQFAVTSNDNIAYLDNIGNWTAIDSFVDRSQYFVITKPIVRYDTLKFGEYPHPQIVSDTSRVIYNELVVNLGFQVKPGQILQLDDITLDDIQVQVPKCHRAIILMGVSSSASLMLLIDTLGIVKEIYFLETSGNSLWNEIADKNIESVQFKPIMINGKAVKSWLIIPIGNYVEIIREIDD